MMDAAAVRTLVAEAVKQALEAMGNAVTPGPRRTGDAMHKFYTRIEKFDGSTASWKEWHYQFEVATGTYDQKTAGIMGKIQDVDDG